jgi:hypothetical protein
MHSVPGLTQLLDDIADCDEIIIINTEKNRKTRYELGITVLDQKNLIKSLDIKDYFEGPLIDHDPCFSGELFIFKKIFYGESFYIKIKELQIIEDDKIIKCISCHLDFI